jgi:hypothetical protein
VRLRQRQVGRETDRDRRQRSGMCFFCRLRLPSSCKWLGRVCTVDGRKGLVGSERSIKRKDYCMFNLMVYLAKR